MGFLKVGEPLPFDETLKRNGKIKLLGTLQLLRGYLQNVHRRDEVRMFGHECEYILVRMDPEKREVKLMPCAPDVIELINDEAFTKKHSFLPEFASYMIEGTPLKPWELESDFVPHILSWFEDSCDVIQRCLGELGIKDIYPLTLTSFPLLGVPNSVYRYKQYLPESLRVMESDFCDDILVHPHPRFNTLARNIRSRRGKKVHITTPMLVPSGSAISESISTATKPLCCNDKSGLNGPDGSNSSKNEKTLPPPAKKAKIAAMYFVKEVDSRLSDMFLKIDDALVGQELANEIDNVVASSSIMDITDQGVAKATGPNDIYMDAMVFGMGMGCIQTTFSCVDEAEARYLYDQITVLSPLFLAMTAATVAHRGIMSELTTRWNVLSQAVDDRRDEEHSKIPFSRFSTVSLFISKEAYLVENYGRLNDVKVPSYPQVYEACLHAGLDRIIARHFAAIFVRDALVAFEEDLEQVNIHKTDAHFEAFQSTNWNTVRFKPPPCNGGSYPIPWRVEFRCCESQMRNDECISLVTLMATTVRMILRERWNLYMPMSLVHENMDASHTQDAITKQRFHFVKDLEGQARETGKFTLYEIFFGNDGLGLFRRCAEQHAKDLDAGLISKESFDVYMDSLKLFENRMRGTSKTNAQEMRDFILNHPEYEGTGLVTHGIVYDMFKPLTEKKL